METTRENIVYLDASNLHGISPCLHPYNPNIQRVSDGNNKMQSQIDDNKTDDGMQEPKTDDEIPELEKIGSKTKMNEEYLKVLCHNCKTNSIKQRNYKELNGKDKLICNECSREWYQAVYQEMYQRIREEYKMEELLKESRKELELLELKKNLLSKK